MKHLLIAGALSMLAMPAFAQTTVKVCSQATSGCQDVGPTNPYPATLLNEVPSYVATIDAHNYSSAGDVMCVSGSNTKVVRLKVLRVSAIASQAVAANILLSIRSAADTGGTPTSVAVMPLDPNNPLSVATVTKFSGQAPTPGNLIGIAATQRLAVAAVGAPIGGAPAQFVFGLPSGQVVTLRGPGNQACLNVSATSGGLWDVSAEWTERLE